MPSECLALLDMNQIKSFIFAAPYLRAIRGSSGLLAKLNDSEASNEVVKRVGDQGGILLYAGGGAVLAKFVSEEKAECFVRQEQAVVYQRTKGGASLTGVCQIIDKSGFGPAILRAQAKLRQEKAHRALSLAYSPSCLFKPCQSCGAQPVELWNRTRQAYVCAVCDMRIIQGETDARRLYHQFADNFGHGATRNWQAVNRAEDLASLTASSQNYLGLIRADGNAMGERIRHLAMLGDENLFRAFSTACRQATEDALITALRNAYPDPRRSGEGLIYPFEVVLLGGDDMEIILTADQCISVALDFCEIFTDRMQAFANEHDQPELAVAMSAGVVLAKNSYPIVLLDDLAEQLLSSAKAKSRSLSADSLTPTLDFMVVTASIAGRVDTVRETDYQAEDDGQIYQFTQRPYELTQLRTLFDYIKHMKQQKENKIPFPNNKLHDLYEIFYPFRSKQQTTLKYLIALNRLSRPHRVMLQKLNEIVGTENMNRSPWRKLDRVQDDIACDTCLVDLVEIFDFVSDEGYDNE